MTRDWRGVFDIPYDPVTFEEVRSSYLERLSTLLRPVDVPIILELHEALRAAQQELGECGRMNVIYLR